MALFKISSCQNLTTVTDMSKDYTTTEEYEKKTVDRTVTELC